MGELPAGPTYLITCAVGLRGYLASLQMAQAGRKAKFLSGGSRSWSFLKALGDNGKLAIKK